MPRTSALVLLALVGALLAGPTYAAPQYSSTAGSGGASNIDCTDLQYRNDPFCQAIAGAPKPLTTTAARRTNELACPASDLVAAGTDSNGNRLYRCVVTGTDRAMTFGY